MATKFKPIVDKEFLKAIIGAERGVRKALRNTPIDFNAYQSVIKGWQRELLQLRKKGESERLIRNAEICLAFAKAMHEENMRRFESYRKTNPNAQPTRAFFIR